jgi:dCTP deaminase
MTIKSDAWIIKKSTKPTHVTRYTGPNGFNPRGDKVFGWSGIDFDGVLGDSSTQVADVHGRVWLPVQDFDLKEFEAENPWFPMIGDFESGQVRKDANGNKAISYGTSSFGYDVRCADEFKIFTNINSATVDPKNFDPNAFVDVKSDVCIIPPNSFALARTVEWFKIPRDVLTICLGKSTYARCGIIVNVTPLEPEWEGHVTLEFSNTTTLPAKIYANEGVAQMLFLQSDEECLTSYKDRAGKYQSQRGVTLPKA